GREREQAHEVEGFEAQAAPDVRWLGRPVGAVLLAHRPRHSPPAVCGIGPAATARPSAPASRARTGPAATALARRSLRRSEPAPGRPGRRVGQAPRRPPRWAPPRGLRPQPLSAGAALASSGAYSGVVR